MLHGRWKAAGAGESERKPEALGNTEVTQAAGPEAGAPVDARISGNVRRAPAAS
jgi:hypothetical protein